MYSIPALPLLVAKIASRNETRPSAPRLAAKLVIDEVLPSFTSLIVSTTMILLAVVAPTLSENSDVLPKLPPPKSTVAVAETRSPALIQRATVALIVALPTPSVMTVVEPK